MPKLHYRTRLAAGLRSHLLGEIMRSHIPPIRNGGTLLRGGRGQRRSEGGAGCGPHWAAFARGGKRTKIVFKNLRENSGCNLRAIKTKHYSCSCRPAPTRYASEGRQI